MKMPSTDKSMIIITIATLGNMLMWFIAIKERSDATLFLMMLFWPTFALWLMRDNFRQLKLKMAAWMAVADVSSAVQWMLNGSNRAIRIGKPDFDATENALPIERIVNDI